MSGLEASLALIGGFVVVMAVLSIAAGFLISMAYRRANGR